MSPAAPDERATAVDTGLDVCELTCVAGYRTLFSQLSFRLEPGQWLCLSGPNGCGKSTLLRALAGLGQPSHGEVRWGGESTGSDRQAWHSTMAYQGHLPACKDMLSASENLRWQLALDGQAHDASVLADCLERVGLGRQARLPYGRLSAGQRRRLGLARLHALKRPLWLLDEPTTALDADGHQLFGELLDAHLGQRGCAVVATHLGLRSAVAPISLALGESARQ